MTGTKKTRFLNADEIERGINDLVKLSCEQCIPIALAGGAALQLYGSDRLTVDVDVLAVAELSGLSNVMPLSFGGIGGITSSGVAADVIVRNDDYADLYAKALSEAITIGDLPLKVVSPEYMIAIKLAAQRDKDQVDLKWLLVNGPIDYALARQIVKRELGVYAADGLDLTRDEAVWLNEREKKKK